MAYESIEHSKEGAYRKKDADDCVIPHRQMIFSAFVQSEIHVTLSGNSIVEIEIDVQQLREANIDI